MFDDIFKGTDFGIKDKKDEKEEKENHDKKVWDTGLKPSLWTTDAEDGLWNIDDDEWGEDDCNCDNPQECSGDHSSLSTSSDSSHNSGSGIFDDIF